MQAAASVLTGGQEVASQRSMASVVYFRGSMGRAVSGEYL